MVIFIVYDREGFYFEPTEAQNDGLWRDFVGVLMFMFTTLQLL